MTLDANILGPLDEAGEISLGLNVTTDSKVTRILLEQRALDELRATLGTTAACNNLLSNFLGLYIEIKLEL